MTLDNSTPFRRANSEYFLKNYGEMLLLPRLPSEAIKQTLVIADACDFELDFSSYCFPDFDLPSGETERACLDRLCRERIPSRYGGIPNEVKARLEQELALIEKKKMCGYFLVVWDIMEFAHRNGILVQGRGSAAGSLVAYLLGIAPVDPIKHGLFVGRFLAAAGSASRDYCVNRLFRPFYLPLLTLLPVCDSTTGICSIPSDLEANVTRPEKAIFMM